MPDARQMGFGRVPLGFSGSLASYCVVICPPGAVLAYDLMIGLGVVDGGHGLYCVVDGWSR